MNCFKLIPMFFFVIQALLAANAFSLNAPYLSSATPTNGHSIALTWRNNDFDATQVLVLRKTAATEWVLKDSVAGTVTSYTDSSLQPLTEYSFALLASAPGVLSDTSNILTATTLEESEVFVAPKFEVLWVEGQNVFDIRFFDSSNTEKGFRLYRKTLTESWASIDSVVTQAPDTVAWKSFADSTIEENKWYSYKVQIYNDSLEAFSPETTVYNYVPPKKTKSYVMTKKGSIPAKPISWVERIGDSLYFPEVAAPGDTEISVIDVSNSLSPLFRGYVDPMDLPEWLKGSVVEARVVIRCKSRNLFTHRNGYYIVSRDSMIYQYDSVSLLVYDSTMISGTGMDYKLIGWLDDSCCMVDMTNSSYSHYAWPVHFGVGGIDVFPYSMAHFSDFIGTPYPTEYCIWGCNNKIAVFYKIHFHHYSTFLYSEYFFQDFSTGFSTPLTFSKNSDVQLFGTMQSRVIDTSVVFITLGSTLYTFDIKDAHSAPTQSYLGKLVDSNPTYGNVKEILVDTSKNCLYLIGSSGIAIYSYEIGPPAGIRNPPVSRNSPSKRLFMTQSSRGVSFSIIGAKMQGLQILNAKGQVIRSEKIPAGETIVWNRRDNAGRAVPVGFYIYKIRTLKDGVIAGSMVLAR